MGFDVAFSNSFNYHTIKIYKGNKLLGFVLFSVREGHLKTLHFSQSENIHSQTMLFLKQFCLDNKIERLTIYNKGIATEFLQNKFPFLRVKKYGQKIYSTFDIEIADNQFFQDGDGDVIFT